ncbi:MAG TPA: extracellular solute-binding protein [Tepidisphaeraceae bacterium]|jgi:iron(III) transport system substrate-binding protein
MNTDRRSRLRLYLCLSALIWGFLFSCGCDRSPTSEVVLYTSVDQPYAEPIVREFEKQTGIHVRLVTDTEASKSVGLAERLRAEKANPQCDVWWGNEPFNTINLADEGLLQPYESPSAKDVTPMYVDPEHRWAGNGLRARMIAFSDWNAATLVGDGLEGLTNARLKGKIAMARPTAGTTGGHVAALWILWGEPKAVAFFQALRANDIRLLGGNGPVAEAVAARTVWAGLTDNDDIANASQENAKKISSVLPDQKSQGTLMIPTTVGLVTGSKNADAAKQLIDYLLSPGVEQKMIDAKFAGWSVRKPNDVKAMQVDYHKVAQAMPEAIRRATAILEGRE